MRDLEVVHCVSASLVEHTYGVNDEHGNYWIEFEMGRMRCFPQVVYHDPLLLPEMLRLVSSGGALEGEPQQTEKTAEISRFNLVYEGGGCSGIRANKRTILVAAMSSPAELCFVLRKCHAYGGMCKSKQERRDAVQPLSLKLNAMQIMDDAKLQWLLGIINKHPGEKVIVYGIRAETLRDLASDLRKRNIKASSCDSKLVATKQREMVCPALPTGNARFSCFHLSCVVS